MEFRNYREADYEAVCEFLIALNREKREHINWNWARFEWMYEHPECDRSVLGSIGLWWDGGRVVGAAIYDMYFGEAFCGVLPEYPALYPEVLAYAEKELRDEAGLAIAIPDGCAAELAAAKAAGFAEQAQDETIMALELEGLSPAPLPEGLRLASPDPVRDAEALQWLFWQGFDHGNDRAEFEREEQIVPQVRRHLDPALGLAAVTGEGEPVAFCCVWYHPATDYAYVEPVCTIPAWRGRGAAKAILTEALSRAAARGAKQAYVISTQRFYERLGFAKTAHYTFYRKA